MIWFLYEEENYSTVFRFPSLASTSTTKLTALLRCGMAPSVDNNVIMCWKKDDFTLDEDR